MDGRLHHCAASGAACSCVAIINVIDVAEAVSLAGLKRGLICGALFPPIPQVNAKDSCTAAYCSSNFIGILKTGSCNCITSLHVAERLSDMPLPG